MAELNLNSKDYLMKRSNYFFFLLFIFLGSCISPKVSETADSPWRKIFNGKNLDGWGVKIKGYKSGNNYRRTFRVDDGILRVNYDGYDRYDKRYGALFYHEVFTNYRLKVEYRFVGDTVAGAPTWGYRDSGIQYHCQSASSMGLDQDFPVSLEFNLHGGNGKDDRPVGQICTIGTQVDIEGETNTSFCTPPTVPITLHGDQWVTAEIDVQGDTISHWINGTKVLEFTNPRYNPDHEWGGKILKKKGRSLRSGQISFQSNSAPIEFRKIEIMPYP